MGKPVTGESLIIDVTMQKGKNAAAAMEGVFCVGECCQRSTHQLGFAAKLVGKEAQLPGLIKELNAMEDVR